MIPQILWKHIMLSSSQQISPSADEWMLSRETVPTKTVSLIEGLAHAQTQKYMNFGLKIKI